MNHQLKISSPVGTLYLVASAKGLCGVYREKQPALLITNAKGVLAQAAKELAEYFAGEREQFEVPLDLQGTAFQQQVWQALLEIPYGETVAYKDIAKRIRNRKAMRAVGSANGKNPVCIIVPCHRVIAADGTLGGYAGGLEMKKKLLRLESERA